MSQPAPIPQACHNCGHHYAGAICNLCRTERPAFTAIKAMSAARAATAPLPPCRYAPAALCGCDQRGECLETV